MANDSNMSWEQVQADPRFQKADAPTRYKIEQAWRAKNAAQTPAPQEATPTPQQPAAPTQPQEPQDWATRAGNTIANFGQGAVAGFGNAIGEGIGGTVKMVEDTLGTSSTYGERMLHNTRQQYQRDMAESGKAGEYGAMAGQVAGDIGAMVVAPEVAIPAIAARETGRAYANQKPGEESVGRALGVGAANYVAGRILPGATSEIAEGLIGRGIASATRVAKGAGAGAAGGGLVGMSQVYNENPEATAGEVIGGGIRGGLTGAAFGGTISGVHEVAGSVSGRTAKAASDVANELPPVEKADLTQEAATVGEAQTPQQKADAYKVAAGLRSVKGSSALEARGIPLTDSRFAYSPEAAAAHGVTPEQVQTSMDASRESSTNAMTPWTDTLAPGKMAVAKSQWETGGKQLVNDMKGHIESGADAITTFKNQVATDIKSRSGEITPAERSANNQLMADIDQFHKDYSAWSSDINAHSETGGVRSENALDSAARVEESYNKLPDYFKQEFDAQLKDVGEGFQKGFSPVDNTATYMDSFNQLKSMHSSFRNANTNPTQGAVKGVQGTSAIDLGTAAFKAFRARGARNKMVAEQERNASTTRQLAAGLANAEKRTAATVDNARANMEEPVVNDGTQDQMKYSSEEPPVAEPATTVTPQPDQGLVRTPRQLPPEAPVAETVPAPEPTPAPDTSGATFDLAARPRVPEPTPEPVEAVATQETPAPVEEAAPAPQPDQTLTRQPTRPAKSAGERYDELAKKLAEHPRGLTEGESLEMTNLAKELGIYDTTTPEVGERLPTTAPARPVEEAPAPVEEAPAPVEEPAPQPQPDQGLVREPTRPQEEAPAAEEPTPEAPETPSERPKAEPDQTLARTPKAPEKPAGEPIHEAAEPEPKVDMDVPKNASAFEKHVIERTKTAVGLVKKMFSVKSVQDKVTPENYNDKRVLQRLKREDVAANTEDVNHAVDQLAIKKKKADQRNHENNLNELENWAKENGIDYKFVNQAIEQKGLQKSMILGVNDIKVRATKAAVEASKPPKVVEEKAEIVPVKWQDQINDFRSGLKDLNTEARAKSAQMIEQAFQASQKTGRPLTDSDVHGLWQKIYNHEADVLAKAGKSKEAAEAKAKSDKEKADAEAISSAKKAYQEKQADQEAENVKFREQMKLGEQTDDIAKQINKQLTEAGLSKEDADTFTNNYMDENFGVLRTPMNDVRYNANRKNAIEAARKYGKDFDKKNPAEKAEALHGADETTENAKKVFDEVGKRVKGADKDSAEVEDNLAEVLIDRAETAFREGNSVADVESAASALIKAYGLDETAGYSIRRYPKVIAKAQAMKEKYPDNPEVWLSQTDVDSLAKAGRVNADGMKAKITDTVLGKRYDSVKLLPEKQAQALRERLDAGEKVSARIDKGRGALSGGETTTSAKPQVKVRPRTNAQRFGVGKMPAKKPFGPKPEPEPAPKAETPKAEPTKRKEYGYEADARNEKIISAALKAHNPNTPEPVRKVAREMSKGWDEDQLTNTIKAVGKAKRSLGKFENRSPGEGRYLETLGYELDRIRKELRKGK